MTTPDYIDERWCDNCDKYTNHICRDDLHERDSSYDYQCCMECHWFKYGISGEYHPPI